MHPMTRCNIFHIKVNFRPKKEKIAAVLGLFQGLQYTLMNSKSSPDMLCVYPDILLHPLLFSPTLFKIESIDHEQIDQMKRVLENEKTIEFK